MPARIETLDDFGMFIVETVRAGLAVESPGAQRSATATGTRIERLAPQMQAVFEARFANLGHRARALVDLFAVHGRPLSIDLLTSLALLRAQPNKRSYVQLEADFLLHRAFTATQLDSPMAQRIDQFFATVEMRRPEEWTTRMLAQKMDGMLFERTALASAVDWMRKPRSGLRPDDSEGTERAVRAPVVRLKPQLR